MRSKYILSLLIVLTSLWSSSTYSQDYSRLEKKVKKAEQSGDWEEKLNAYLEILDTMYWDYANIASTIDYGVKIVDLCEGHDCGEQLLLTRLYIARSKGKNNDFEEMETFVLPTIKNYEFKSPIIKAHFYHLAGEFLYLTSKHNKAKNYFSIAQRIYKNEANLGKPKYWNHLFSFFIYQNENNIDSLFYHINQAIKLANSLKKSSFQVVALNALTTHHANVGNISKAIKTQLELIDLAEASAFNENDLCLMKARLALYYSENHEHDEAFKIIESTLEQLKIIQQNIEEVRFNMIKTSVYEKLVLILQARGKFKEALAATDTILNYSPRNTDVQFYFKAQTLKISSLISLKRYQQAEALSYSLFKEIKEDKISNYVTITNFAENLYHLYSTSDLVPAPSMMTAYLALFNDYITNPKNAQSTSSFEIHRLIALLHLYQGDTQSAKEYLATAFSIKDSLTTQETSRLSKELLVQYQTKEKEQQLEYQALELAQKTTQRNLLIILAIFLIGIGWYFWRLGLILKVNKQTIEAQTNELQKLYDGKNRFFTNIAHELRTPLTLIASPVNHIIKDESLSTTTRQRLNTVYRNTTYLKQLVNQILDLSKREIGELTLQVQAFHFSDLLKALISDFQPFADYQRIEFITPTNLDYEVKLTTDGEKLFIVLKNLLSNAFKYTPTNGRVILNSVDLGETLQVSVQDNGRGISKTDLPNIFNRYFQTANPDTPIEGGTGIGLTIVKEYIERLGGSIKVNSKLTKGSTFIVVFPKHLKSDVPFSTAPLSFLEKNNILSLHTFNKETIKKTTQPNSQTLLVVEDNVDISQHLQSILAENYQLILASNGKEALKLLEEKTPDLILTDLMMPVMDGFELIERLKSNEKWYDIPIITLTARSGMTNKLTALRIGVDDYLVKPFHEEELSLRIQNLLNNQQKRHQFLSENTEDIGDIHSDKEPPSSSTSLISAEDRKWLTEVETLVKAKIGNVDFNTIQLYEELSISNSTLYRNLKRLTGLSPGEYINQTRYMTARKLLEDNTYQSVKRVAYEVGFKDEKNFARNFKKRFGKYPSEYGI